MALLQSSGDSSCKFSDSLVELINSGITGTIRRLIARPVKMRPTHMRDVNLKKFSDESFTEEAGKSVKVQRKIRLRL